MKPGMNALGLVRPEGALEPHAEVLKKLAGHQADRQSRTMTVKLDISPDENLCSVPCRTCVAGSITTI